MDTQEATQAATQKSQQQLVPELKTSVSTASDYQTIVQQLYIAYFGRPADPAGLTNFTAALTATNVAPDIQDITKAYATNAALASLIDSFGNSKESQTLYGSGDTTAFVSAIFGNVIGRQPQQAGLQFWVDAVNSGSVSRGDAALAIMSGGLTNQTAQGLLDAQLIKNRLAVANYFTGQVSGLSAVADYSGATAAASARTMLNAVTASTSPIAFQPTVNAVIEGLIAVPPTTQNVATATMNPSAVVMTTSQESLIASATPTQLVFNGSVTFTPGTVVIGASHAFKVVSTSASGGQTIVAVTEPELSDLFSSLVIQGTYTASSATAEQARSHGQPALVAKTAVSGSAAFSWPYSISDGGFSLNATLSSTVSATVNYNYQQSAGGLLAASLSVSANNQAVLSPSYNANASSSTEQLLGTVTIPINVTVANAALNALGVKLVSIRIPVYAGATLNSAFKLADTFTVNANGTVFLQYTPTAGPTATSTFAGNFAEGAPTVSGAGTASATLTEKGSVYLRLAPSLSFVNSVALLGVDTRVSVDDNNQLQATSGTPAYCLTGSAALNVAANGFFKSVGLAPLKTSVYNANLYQGPTYHAGSCQAAVTVQAGVSSAQPVAYGSPVTVSATVAFDTTQGTTAPTLPPSGQVTISAGGASCQATLSAASTTSATGSCSLVPLSSGNAVPVTADYLGNGSYASGDASTMVSVAGPSNSLLGSIVTLTENNPLTTEVTLPVSASVGQGVTFSSGNLLTLGGNNVIGSTLTVGANYVLVSYNVTATGAVSSFNGPVFTFASGAPTILGCSVDPASNLPAMQVSCNANQVFINGSGVAVTPTSRILVDLQLGPPSN